MSCSVCWATFTGCLRKFRFYNKLEAVTPVVTVSEGLKQLGVDLGVPAEER